MSRIALILAAALTLAACEQRMIEQEKLETWEAETAALGRHPPDGAVARGTLERLRILETRPELTPALIERGQVVYDRVCALCHGRTGRGDGIIVARGYPAPPSYHSERLRQAAPEYVVAVITNGYGVMYPYANRVAPEDRWAVAAYVQALQRLGARIEPLDAAGAEPAAFTPPRPSPQGEGGAVDPDTPGPASDGPESASSDNTTVPLRPSLPLGGGSGWGARDVSGVVPTGGRAGTAERPSAMEGGAP
ncbi:MAG: cytochrome c [Oceanicaulis sp.]